MNADNTLNILLKLQRTQNNITLYSAISMGFVLIIYFFTFAILMDKGYKLILLFEVITGAIFFAAFFFLNKISFFATRLLSRKHKPQHEIMQLLSVDDMSKKPEVLLEKINTGLSRQQTL